jgi:hypothetical protein
VECRIKPGNDNRYVSEGALRSFPLARFPDSSNILPMSEIVNLRQAKKRRARAEKEAQAAANRATFGRTKAERKQTAAERARALRDLDGKKRD